MLIPKNAMHHVTQGSDKDFERICIRFTDECIAPFVETFGEEKFNQMMETGVVNVPLNRRKDVEVCMNGYWGLS